LKASATTKALEAAAAVAGDGALRNAEPMTLVRIAIPSDPPTHCIACATPDAAPVAVGSTRARIVASSGKTLEPITQAGEQAPEGRTCRIGSSGSRWTASGRERPAARFPAPLSRRSADVAEVRRRGRPW
jgi:hypothetical protein